MTEERVGKINKSGAGCDDFMRALDMAQRCELERWLVPYEAEPLPDVLRRLDPEARAKLEDAFPEPADHFVYWMPNLIRDLKERARCATSSVWSHLCNEVKTIDLKIITQDVYQIKARPPVYRESGVMIDDLRVSLAHIDSIYMKHVFNRNEKGQAALVKMFLMDLTQNAEGKVKAVHNIALGMQILSELHALAAALARTPVMYKYSILVLRNADAFSVKLIDIEDDPSRACMSQQRRALDTMLAFWQRALGI